MSGGTFSHTFDTAGTFLYHCEVHPTLMNGQIVVLGADTPGPPTSTATVSDLVSPGTVTPTSAGLPTTGHGDSGGGSSTSWALIGAGAIGLAFLVGAGALYSRTRRA